MKRALNTLAVGIIFLAGGLASSQLAHARLTSVAGIPIVTTAGLGSAPLGHATARD